jgi:hypothetical protein
MVKKIFTKIILAALPAIILAALYVYADPFLVLYKYEDFFATGKKHFELNEDYVSTEYYLKSIKTKSYDAYIMGNSRSRYYNPNEWEKRNKGITPYYMGVAGETIFGVVGKIKLINRKGQKIKDVLLVADYDLFSRATDSKGHLFMKHPEVSGESMFDFQLASARDFFNFDAINQYFRLPPVATNTELLADKQKQAEEEIRNNPDEYYQKHRHLFYKRMGVVQHHKKFMTDRHRKLLKEMKAIFEKHKTKYKIIISPMYDQKVMDTGDSKEIAMILGADNIYDFSGVNGITNDVYNYFEPEHYRPHVANTLMDAAYSGIYDSIKKFELQKMQLNRQ